MIKTRSVIIGAIALFVLAGAAIALLLYQPGGEKEENAAALEVTKITYEDIASVTVQNEEGSFTVSTAAETPVIEGEDAARYNAQGILALVNVLSNITASKKTEAAETELANFGLDQPQSTVSISLKDGSAVTLSLGMQNPMDNSWSVAKGGSNLVYTVEETIGSAMLMGKNNYRDMTLISGADSEQIKKLKKIVISQDGGKPQKIVLEQLPFKEDAVLITYKMVAPVLSNLNWEKVDSDVIARLNDFKADGILADDPDLAKYGLDQPAYTLELQYTDKTQRVFVTPSPDEDYLVAAVEGKDTVYLIKSAKAEFLKADYKSLIGDSAYIRNATTVKRITISAGGESVEAEVTGDAEMVEPKIKGQTVDQNTFMSFYLTATKIPLVRELTKEDAVGEVQMEMVFYLRDGQKDTVELLALNDRQSAVRINGQAAFVTYTKIIDDILNTYKLLEPKQ